MAHIKSSTKFLNIEKKLEADRKLPDYYWRYVDDTLTLMPNVAAAEEFCATLNMCHPALKFTMEVAQGNKLAFCGFEISVSGNCLKIAVYHKPTDTGLLLHFQSYVDIRYKRCLIRTMLHRAYNFSSDWQAFHKEVVRLKSTFTALGYPVNLFDTILDNFLLNKHRPDELAKADDVKQVRFLIPYKGMKPAAFVKQRLNGLSSRLAVLVQPIFTSRKIAENFGAKEEKPKLVNQQCVVYEFECDRCDAGYVGITTQHLHQRIDGHTVPASSICKHYLNDHNIKPTVDLITPCFKVIRKCRNKFECLMHEMFYIQELEPSLNVQGDSLRAKVFK